MTKKARARRREDPPIRMLPTRGLPDDELAVGFILDVLRRRKSKTA